MACVNGPFSEMISIRPCHARKGPGVAESAGLADVLPARLQITRASERSMTSNALGTCKISPQEEFSLVLNAEEGCTAFQLISIARARSGQLCPTFCFHPRMQQFAHSADGTYYVGYLHKFAPAATRSSLNTHNMALKL